MSDNTRMQTARGRDALHPRIHFHGRALTGWSGLPSQKLRRDNLRSSKAGLPSRSRGAAKAGGARRDRTDDLLLAKQALSQLSYGPESADARLRLRFGGQPSQFEGWLANRSSEGAKVGG